MPDDHYRSLRDVSFKPRGSVYPSPRDWRDHFFYQLLVDRFDDGGTHPAFRPGEGPRGAKREEAGSFQGGKLKGITRRLDYIRGLGCTAIWISPPFKGRQDDAGSYHGYGIQDFLAIDPRFGTTADLRELVEEAHRRGMYVIADIVINHTADVFRYAQDDTPFRAEGRYDFKAWHKISRGAPGEALTADDAIWPVELQDPEAFKRKGAIRDLMKASPEEALHGDFFALKELAPANPKVMEVLVGAYKHWIAATDLDGYRIDTVGNVEPRHCAHFCYAIHEYARRIGKDNFLLFGEIVADDNLLKKYVGNNGPADGTEEWYPRLDATLDFPLYAMLEESIKGHGTCNDLRGRYDHLRRYFRELSEAARYYVTFIDNHDQSHRPWRRFLHGTGPARDRLGVLGIGFLLTNLGIPCLYYGTEQGFDGGGDSDAFIREAMFGGSWGAFDTHGVHFFDETHPIYRGIAAIAQVRAEQPALRYGRQYFRDISGDGEHFGCPQGGGFTLAYSRILDTDEVLVALNLDTAPRNDWVRVDAKLSPPGTTLVNLLGGPSLKVEAMNGGAAVRVALEGQRMGIYKVG